jgi:hypothetical protein
LIGSDSPLGSGRDRDGRGQLGCTHWSPLGLLHWPRAGEVEQTQLVRFQSEARLGQLGWATRKIEKAEGKEEVDWAGLRFQLGFGPLPNRN